MNSKGNYVLCTLFCDMLKRKKTIVNLSYNLLFKGSLYFNFITALQLLIYTLIYTWGFCFQYLYKLDAKLCGGAESFKLNLSLLFSGVVFIWKILSYLFIFVYLYKYWFASGFK